MIERTDDYFCCKMLQCWIAKCIPSLKKVPYRFGLDSGKLRMHYSYCRWSKYLEFWKNHLSGSTSNQICFSIFWFANLKLLFDTFHLRRSNELHFYNSSKFVSNIDWPKHGATIGRQKQVGNIYISTERYKYRQCTRFSKLFISFSILQSKPPFGIGRE